ncbi:unknown [Prevotella sp. CAG:891]|nr:unknown [Prevotella sp. CAG:891]
MNKWEDKKNTLLLIWGCLMLFSKITKYEWLHPVILLVNLIALYYTWRFLSAACEAEISTRGTLKHLLRHYKCDTYFLLLYFLNAVGYVLWLCFK